MSTCTLHQPTSLPLPPPCSPIWLQANGCGGVIVCPTCPTGQSCNATGSCYSELIWLGGWVECARDHDSTVFFKTDSPRLLLLSPTAPTAPCKPILATGCTKNSDCCWSDTDTFCDLTLSPPQCKVKRGGKCSTAGKCGMCHPSCGGDTLAATCAAYGFPVATCNHAGAGGGGTQCGTTNVCCVIQRPTTIQPESDGHCIGQIA